MLNTIRKNTSLMKFSPWAAFAALALLVLYLPTPANSNMPDEKIFRIDAKRFDYEPGVLHASLGDQVTIELRSHDVVHGLVIEGYNLELVAEPGQTARLTFIADHEGTFNFSCSVTCGDMHPFMRGKLQIGNPIGLWRAAGLLFLAAVAGVWLAVR